MASRRRDRLRRAGGSVRVRVTLLAAGAFAVTLLVASWLLLRSLERTLVDDIRRADAAVLEIEAATVIEAGMPVDAEIEETDHGPIAQWSASDGQQIVMPVEPSESGPGYVPAGADRVSAGGVDIFGDLEDVPDICTTGECIVSNFPLPEEGAVLHAFSPLAEVQSTIATTRNLLWVVGPLLVALVAGLAWLLASRALRPVHVITSRVSAIGSKSLHERVPVPESGDEITELAQTMNQMLARLESAADTNRRLVSDASHELRTPVAVMRTELEVATRGSDNDWSATGDVLLGELDRLQELVDDLLLLASGDERALASEDVDVIVVVHEVAARRRPVTVDVTSGPESLVVRGDHQALVRAFDHLAANAARSADRRVTISVELDGGGEVAVHVDDDGPGIPAEHRELVVQRFVRLDEGRARDEGGAGLGLAVAADVAAAHGGELVIDDSPLGGARVSIVLPACRDEV